MSILKKKPKLHFEFGGAFVADFYMDGERPDAGHNYLHVYTPNGVFEQKIVGYPYAYLISAVSHGREEEVRNYCAMLWRVSQEVYQDPGFADDIVRAINKRDRRLMKRAEREAKAVTPEREMAEDAFMREVADFADATPRERKRMREEGRELMRGIISGKEDGDGE